MKERLAELEDAILKSTGLFWSTILISDNAEARIKDIARQDLIDQRDALQKQFEAE